jgi:hypothetical protein
VAAEGGPRPAAKALGKMARSSLRHWMERFGITEEEYE